MTVLCIAQDGHFVVIEVDFVDKHIHQSLPVFGVVDVPLAELVEEKSNFLHAGGRMLGGFHKKLKGEFLMLFLLLCNPVSDNINGLSTLQGLQQIFCGLLIFCKQFFKPPCVAVVALSFTEVNNFSGNRADIVWGQEIPQSVDHQIFYVLFSNRLFVTGFVPAVGHTLIIVIFPLCLTSPTDTSHGGLTVSTEQFCGKEIIYFSLRSCGGFFVFLHNALCLPKQIFINDAGESIRNFLIPVCIYPYVSLVSQNAVNAVLVEFISVGCFDLIGIEIADNISHRLAAGVHLKNFLHDGSGVRVNLNMFLAVYTKAQRQIAACGKAFFGVDVHATPYLLREFDAVILCHSLQHGLHQHTRSIIGDVLTGGQHTDAVLFELGLVGGAVIAVAGKAVKLIDQYGLKELFVPVRNHAQKFRAVIGCAGNGTVNVFAYNGIAVAPCVLIALFQLSLNTLLCLAVRRVAGIDYNIHFGSSVDSLTIDRVAKYSSRCSASHFLYSYSARGSFCLERQSFK